MSAKEIIISAIWIVLFWSASAVIIHQKWMNSKRSLNDYEIKVINERMKNLQWNIERHNRNWGLIKYYVMRTNKYIKWLSYGIKRTIDIDEDLEEEDPYYRKFEKEKQREYEYEEAIDMVNFDFDSNGNLYESGVTTKKKKKPNIKNALN